jgi:beta-mannosidase
VDVEISRDDEFTDVHIYKEKRLQVRAMNFGIDEVSTELSIQGIDVLSGKTTWERRLHVLVLPNQSTELFDERLEDPAEQTIFLAHLIKEDKVIARVTEWPQPLRHLDLPNPSVNVRVEGDHIHVSSPLPVNGVVFDVEDNEINFDDNWFDSRR